MNLNGNPIAVPSKRHVMISTIVAVLAMAAMVLGLLAAHSAVAGHETSGMIPAASASAPEEAAIGADGMAVAAVTAVAIVAHVDGGWLSDGNGFLVGCALMAITCSVLLVLASLVLLARRPAVYQRLLDALGFVVYPFRTIPLHLHRPSLTVLSITRV